MLNVTADTAGHKHKRKALEMHPFVVCGDGSRRVTLCANETLIGYPQAKE
ncbi:MAG: hypothetical protein ACMZI0_13210 [Symbiopectobacterium sp.]